MTTLTRQDLNFGQVVADILCEFLEVAIHLILYVREVYPSGIFQKRKKYNVPVQMSCHPELNQYIHDTLHCVKPLIEKNDAEKVVVVIMDKEHHPVERFVFEISQPPLLSISSDTLLSHVEQLLRAVILKISVCDAVLENNPPGCTFTVLVHTREAATRNMEKVQVIKVSVVKNMTFQCRMCVDCNTLTCLCTYIQSYSITFIQLASPIKKKKYYLPHI
ncbi:mitotic spindle assembly checkpoint protein MAD2B isoform X3 [Salmo trutta]|nr:mitotic spindle assembly checkpoint protein MAD2B isoform X3 [Salmo trutta]XP_029579053.1 mitotic spindle assembly checkpoint protein MAD2B isoform X3 [Salmo trutta]